MGAAGLGLRGFEADVKCGVGAVTCAYNAVNGAYSCENGHLLRQMLREDWGFKGFVASSFGATVPPILAGLDLEMQWANYFSVANVEQALANGWKTMDDMMRCSCGGSRPNFASGCSSTGRRRGRSR